MLRPPLLEPPVFRLAQRPVVVVLTLSRVLMAAGHLALIVVVLRIARVEAAFLVNAAEPAFIVLAMATYMNVTAVSVIRFPIALAAAVAQPATLATSVPLWEQFSVKIAQHRKHAL